MSKMLATDCTDNTDLHWFFKKLL